MKLTISTLAALCAFELITPLSGATNASILPPPTIVMPSSSKPLVVPPSGVTPSAVASGVKTFALSSTPPSVNMKVLVLAGDLSEFSYVSITSYLDRIGVPYTGIAVDTLTPDASGNRLTNLVLTDSSSGHGLYQGLIYTNSTFGVCSPVCQNLLTAADFTTLSDYISKYKVRVVTYYTYPEPKWGLSIVGSGASYQAANPLQVGLSAAGATVFSYINKANPVPVSGSGTGGIYGYLATPVAAAGETTTPILTSGANVVGVTHVNAAGQESMSLTFDNFPTLLHSLAFSYGVINWVTKGVFLGQRQIYINPQVDDILFGDRLYAPTLPQCPNDPSCPDIIGTGADVQALANWQNAKHQDPQFPYIKSSYAFVGFGSTPSFAPIPDTVTPAMKAHAADFGWVSHTWTHGDLDCYSLSLTGTCQPATFAQSLFEIEQNAVFAQMLPIPNDTTGMVTPFNGGLSNLAFFQAAAQEGITSVISPNNPPSAGTGSPSIVPSILLMPRRATNLFYDVDSPMTGVYGSLPDEYNSLYGPNGKTPAFTVNQTYSQIIDNESTMLLQLRLLTYEPFPLAFHNSNVIAYDGTHTLMTDLFDATLKKFEALYTLPIYTLKDMRDIAPLLLNRASYNTSGVTGVYTPGISIVLTTTNAAVIPVTGACSQAICPAYGGQIQDRVAMAANSSVTLSLTSGTGAGLSNVTVNPGSVGSRTPSVGVVSLNGIATSNIIVNLSSSSPTVTVPTSVTINPGDSGASFTVITGSVTAPLTATISANYNNVTKTVPLTVAPAIALSGLSVISSVAAGASPVATVTLTGPAPAGGAAISLLSNNTAATVPSTVTVSAGSSSATFNVTTLAVGTITSGNLVAIYNGVNAPAAFSVTPGIPLALTGLTLTPTAVIGGSVSTGTVTLNGLAPSGGIAVSLTSSKSLATVPATVYVNYGSSTATFTISTSAVTAVTTSTISATYKGATSSAVLTVANVFGLTSVSVNPAVLLGGNQADGIVTLTGPAPTNGTVVLLTSSNPAATVPPSVTITAGNFTAPFAVNTTAVAASTSVIIGASSGGVNVNSTLTVLPVLAISSVSVSPASVTAGGSSTGTVTLTASAPAGGVSVSLSSNNPAATVPAAVIVSAGNTTATFSVTTTVVTVATPVSIAGTYNGVTKIAALSISPAVVLSGLVLNPASVMAGTPSTGTVTLTFPAPTGGTLVSLSSNSATAVVPTSVTVAAGATTAAFTVSTQPVLASTNVVINATYNSVAIPFTLTVTPAAALSGVSLTPASLIGGAPSTGTVTLTTAAPTGGAVISLSSNNATAKLPATVTVNSGSTTATFTINTTAVAASTSVNISASYLGVAKSATLTVMPTITLSAISLNYSAITAGVPVVGTVTLSAPAPAGGTLITLSSNADAVVPASVTVAAGSSSASFTILTTPVNTVVVASIVASYNGVTKTALLTVNPAAAISGITLNPGYVTGGSVSLGTISLTGLAPAGGLVVSLSSNNGSATLPVTVTVPAGSSTAQFTISTNAVAASVTVTISAGYAGLAKTATLTVIPPALSGLSVNPSSVDFFSSSMGTVTLSGPAPAGGIVVALSSDFYVAEVPQSVTVPAGSSTATFTINTYPFIFTSDATITAAFNGVNQTAVISVAGLFNWN